MRGRFVFFLYHNALFYIIIYTVVASRQHQQPTS